MPGESNHTSLHDPQPVELVRCHTCHAAITPAVVRCPYCGQLTTGTERKISKLELDLQRRERIAERRSRNSCRLCGKGVSANQELCSNCEAKDRKKRVLHLTLLALAVLAILWFFLIR